MKLAYHWLPIFCFTIVTLGSLFFGTTVLAAPIIPGSFSTTWKTDNPGVSGTNQITIPTTGSGYNYNVYWEEVGNDTNNGSSTGHTGNLTITFPSIGTYRVDITGSFPRIYIDNTGDRLKLLTIEQWGSISWASFDRAFAGASNMTFQASDVPNLSLVTDMSYMFAGATAFNQPLNNWDVSNVISMDSMFGGATAFNQPLNNWDVSSVTNMFSMFNGATSFNQPLNNWDVSNVTSMSSLFLDATSFNQPLNNWNVSSVTNMFSMFNGATSFNQPLNNWNVNSLLTTYAMFANTTSFNQPLNNWDVSSVTNMAFMFTGATAFNQSLSNWNISNVNTLQMIFSSSGMTTIPYTATLIGWGALPSLQSNLDVDTVPSTYCSAASTSRDRLITTFNWTIDDGGSVNCYSFSYSAGLNATLIGVGSQTVTGTGSGTAVEVVPDNGYQFVSWSDGVTSNPRTDSNPTADINVTAVVTAVSSGGSGSGSGGGGGSSSGGSSSRPRSSSAENNTSTASAVTASSTNEITDHASFLESVAELLASLDANQAAVANMSAAERQKVIVLLQSIVVYLMSLLVELQF